MSKKLLILLLLFVLKNYAQKQITLDTLSLKQITEIDFSDYSIKDYENAFYASKKKLKDSLIVNYKTKGNILLSVLANNIGQDITNKKFKTTNQDLQSLLLKFEGEKYYIYRPKMSSFIKLMGYACRGNYEHIFNRYKDSIFFFPSIILAPIFLIFFVLSALKKINFRYRVLLNKLVISIISLVILLIIIFKQTCGTQLQEYSFYGIPL